jgi:hypothetical protein
VLWYPTTRQQSITTQKTSTWSITKIEPLHTFQWNPSTCALTDYSQTSERNRLNLIGAHIKAT